MRVTLLGGSGFIGRALHAALAARGDTVATVSLRDPQRAAAATAGSDVVVNLAGASIATRWTARRKRAIAASRVELPRAYLTALGVAGTPPAAYVSASAIGYYGTSRSAEFDETSPPGDDFLAQVCRAWEETAESARALGMRVARLRTGLVLGRDGGALAGLLPVFRLGLGGVVGSGKQWYSWVHLDDVVGLYLRAVDGGEGVTNAVAPQPVTNREFTRALGAALRRPTLLPIPTFALQLVLGEGATLLTEGQRVVPRTALDAGYAFRYPTLAGAFTALV